MPSQKFKYHTDGTLPKNGEIFVFGSNEAGRHGAGAAKVARLSYGATYGLGRGLQGNSYAIPTKDQFIRTLPLEVVRKEISIFVNFTHINPLNYWVTAVGCGLAGYTSTVIAPMFSGCASNCSFPEEWECYLLLK